ncbi:unnamed protein product [Didymodactylos carnosus]|uniref:Uncharacterized protein n=1 Tax=Didymodactylos carnosus TaxID=1234261 RepID=A0A814SQG5_9BILA|nr:unnamed protein product [Didymodactylos carnosus]CAF3914076.1 unnamed protein product [Didymodactylos carnosus]
MDEDENRYFSTYNRDLRPLHPYTNVTTGETNERFLELIRRGLISKSVVSSILQLLSDILPVPNNLPRIFNELLKSLQIDNHYTERIYCTGCFEIVDQQKRLLCVNENYVNYQKLKYDLLTVFDGDVKSLLSSVIKRNLSEIDYYSNQTSPIFDDDIIIGERYRKLKETHNNRPFISLIFHLDEFPLVKSTKFCLWTFSVSIVELRSSIRKRLKNIILLSADFGNGKLNVTIWLQHVVEELNKLKIPGISMESDNLNIYFFNVVYFALIGSFLAQ